MTIDTMQKFHRLFICFAALLWFIPGHAQWSGSVDLRGGLNGMEGSIVSDYKPMFHGLAQGVFQLKYQTDKFSWKTTVDGKWEPKTTDNARFDYKKERVGLVYKASTTKPLSTSIKSDFIWTPSQNRKYSAWIQYKYSNDRASNHSINMDGDVEEMQKFSYYYEIPYMNEHKVVTGGNTYRRFNSGRSILQSSLSLEVISSKRVNTWIVFKTDDEEGKGGTHVDIDDLQGYAWKYRITPESKDFNIDGDIHLQMTLLDGAAKLKYAPGVRLFTRHALDRNSGATLENYTIDDKDEEIWRDSTRLRENFDYLSVRTELYLTADFKWKTLDAHADYACQVFGRRLNDDDHKQSLKIKGVYPVGKGNVKWTISPRHSLNLVNQMSVSHPDYIKVCWYDRTAGYLDQLYRGNENLLSPTTRRYTLEYEFKYNRFVSKTSTSYTRVVNEIDQTWTNEEIEGREYKVFHWINSSDSRGVGITQNLGWNGKIISAHTGITYNQTQRTAKNSDTVKKSFDWRLNTDISANLGKGWRIGAEAKYQSKVATFFTIFKQYCVLNAHIQKEFKKFTLYLEGRDLLDQTMQTSFESEELQQYWVEEVRGNRRIFIIGAKWSF